MLNKSSGSDKLGNIILKKCSDVISLPLSIIFNQSLIDSVFPSAWKMVDVCPIFKKDDPQLCSNYRPISLLSPTSKILERLVFNKLYRFCIDHNVLTPRNSGFKKLDSTVNQLIHVSHLRLYTRGWIVLIKLLVFFSTYLRHSTAFGMTDYFLNWKKLELEVNYSVGSNPT